MDFDEALASLPPDVAWTLSQAAGRGPESRRSRYRALAVELASNPERLGTTDVQPPPLAAQAATLAKAAGRWAASGFARTADDELARRLEACAGCELYDATHGRCGVCGCFVKAKARLATEKCPAEKW